MSDRNYPPAYLRYLKARFSNFLQPSFWGAGVFLIVVAFLVREYWANPEWLTEQENPATTEEVISANTVENTSEEDTLSEEDKAIAADIDNIPNLLNDFAEVVVSAKASILPRNNKAKNSEPLLEDLINQANANANLVKTDSSLGVANQVSFANANNPFVVEAENLLKFNGVYDHNQSLGIQNFAKPAETKASNTTNSLGIGLNNQTTNQPNPVIINPLAVAIQQSNYRNQNPTGINNRVIRQNPGVRPIYNPNNLPYNSTSHPGIGYTQPNFQNLPPSAYRNFNGVQRVPNLGQPNLRQPNQVNPIQPGNSGVINSQTPLGYGNYGNNSLQQQPNPAQRPDN